MNDIRVGYTKVVQLEVREAVRDTQRIINLTNVDNER